MSSARTQPRSANGARCSAPQRRRPRHRRPRPPPITPPATSGSAWSASAVYTSGMTATENGVTYKANWWVQGVDPAQHNGVGDSGEAWTIIAGGTNDPTPWSATKVFTAGLEVSENGITYQANWWVQG